MTSLALVSILASQVQSVSAASTATCTRSWLGDVVCQSVGLTRSTGGSAYALVFPDTTYHTIKIMSYVTQDNGGSQWVGADVWIAPAGKPYVDLLWQTGQTLGAVYSNGGAAAKQVFQRGPAQISPGLYQVYVFYGWLTRYGWETPGEYVGLFQI